MELKIAAGRLFSCKTSYPLFCFVFPLHWFCAKFNQIRLFSLALIYMKTIIPFDCDSSKLLKSPRFFHGSFFFKFADTFNGLMGLQAHVASRD